MADSFFLFENFFDDSSGTLSSTGDAAGFPKENVNDWRQETVYRWKASGTGSVNVKIDAGVGNTYQPDTVVVAGHNMGARGTDVLTSLQYSDNDADWFNVVTYTAGEDTEPWIETFSESAHRYWRIATATGASEAVQQGIFTLGRRLEFESGFGVTPGLDIYGETFVGSRAINRNGSPIGGNLRYVDKTFNITVQNPGMTTTNFFDKAAPNFNATFRDHVRQMKPFWYAWNTDTDLAAVYLCWADGYSQPFEFVTTRRGLQMQLRARVIV